MTAAPKTAAGGLDRLAGTLAVEGFAFVRGAETRAMFAGVGALVDWVDFAASWDDLGLDTYMADGGRYRKRRHAAFGAAAGEPIHRRPHQPHYQSRDYNALNGGIARWFDPVLSETAAGPSMTTILATCRTLFERLAPTRDWHIEAHQFRIEARSGVQGRPTPEGMHRDGVDYVLVLLIGRRNIQSGVTSIHDPDGRDLGSFTLTEPFDAAWVDDHRRMHGVTPVEPIDPGQPGFRDVLVVTFREFEDAEQIHRRGAEGAE
jgi:hypothetical protein